MNRLSIHRLTLPVLGVLALSACSSTPQVPDTAVTPQALASCAPISINQNAYYRITARHSNKSLDIAGPSLNNGAFVHQWTSGNWDSQKWRFQAVGSGFFRITNKYSGKSLDVSEVSLNDGARIHQWDYVGGQNQQWCAIPTDSGYYRILARHSEKALDVSGVSTADGAAVHQWGYVGGQNQQWRFDLVETINQPIWSQEFDGPAGSQPSTGIWNFETGNGSNGWGNQELQNYTNRTSNLSLNGQGQLVLTARREALGTCWNGPCQYTSARLTTQNKYSVLYGRIEARIKVPAGVGLWPAFWTLGNNISSVGWPQSGEIDIMEHIGREPNTIYGTVHGPGYSGCCGIIRGYTFGQPVANDYHVYAIEKRENDIRWYVDGIEYHRVTPASLPAGTQWVFNQPFFLLLNLAVGGQWPGSPNSTTPFPAQMLVDYIRVYP